MANCKHYKHCGLQAIEDTEEGLCILHSQLTTKNPGAFMKAFDSHRKRGGHNYSNFVFPPEFATSKFLGSVTDAIFTNARFTGDVNFRDGRFLRKTDFSGASFLGMADFRGVRFGAEPYPAGPTSFFGAKFAKRADFSGVRLEEVSDFATSMFNEEADFHEAIFMKRVEFYRTTFASSTDFSAAVFQRGSIFIDSKFLGPADFSGSGIFGKTLFASNDKSYPTFRGVEVDFTSVLVEPLDALVIRDADLSKCQFQHTDLRKAEITGVDWPRKGGRFRVYDEDVRLPEGESRLWSHVERLYRELKQNHEERRDFERAGDFHFGEKEMRRRNPKTPIGLRFFLFLYRWISGYGEMYLLPLLWAAILLVSSTVGYLYWGLSTRYGGFTLSCTSLWDWLKAAHYSFRVMTLLRPDDLVPVGYAKVVNTAESLLGPLLIGLFALALRQRLKR